ncbi:beta/alpha barrel domain-containing protein [Aureispira anguillae]|nr:N-(5'-phosphoribosyl)anthranilate isomerase [Aureispira anguillae]
MKIKATSINNLTDARYFAAWNVEWLGFSLEIGHANYTRPQDVKEIKDWLVGPKIVGEFGMAQSLDEIQASIELLNLDAVQLGMFTDDQIALQLKQVVLIKEWVLEELSKLDDFATKCKDLAEQVDYFYLDLEKNGIDWNQLKNNPTALKKLQDLCQEYAILISISCPPAELKSFLDTVQPYGISLQGGEEEKVGVKSFDDLDEIFETLEELDLIGF